MRVLCLLLLTSLIAGCSFKRYGVRFNDEYESVRVEQTVGNHVSGRVFERTLFCLNPRRETRRAPAVTNTVLSYETNVALVYITNQTVTVITNENRTSATNQVVFQPPTPSNTETNETANPAETAGPGAVETNQAAIISSQPSASTNDSLSIGRNVTLSKSPSQVATTINQQRLLTHQVTVSTNNLSVTTAETQAITAETNVVVTTVTNVTVEARTNEVVTHTNLVLRDYYLYAELTPPPDFTLAGGESLVVLVDGVRHGFSPTNTHAALISRRGFSTYAYKVPPEVLVDIANAKKVKVRLRGNSSVVERKMSYFSRNAFRRFVVKYFTPEPSADEMHAHQTTVEPGS